MVSLGDDDPNDPRNPGVNPLWRSRLAHFSPSWDFTLVPVRMRDWNIARASRTAENWREVGRTSHGSHARRQSHVGMCKTKTSGYGFKYGFKVEKPIQVSTLSLTFINFHSIFGAADHHFGFGPRPIIFFVGACSLSGSFYLKQEESEAHGNTWYMVEAEEPT